MYIRCLFSLVFVFFALIGLGCSCDAPPFIGDIDSLTTDLPKQRLLFVRSDATANVDKTFLLYNQGTAPVVLTSASITGDTTPSFAFVEPPAFPLTLAPGKDKGLLFKIKHTPTSLNNQIARIAFAYGALARSTTSILYVELQAHTPRGQLHFSCGVLAFGKVNAGQQKTESCLIRNIGEQTLTINAILFDSKKTAAQEFRLKDVAFPLILAPGEDETLFVTYAPQDHEETEDVGRFVFESDILLEPGQARPSLEVRGTTLVSLLEIIPQFSTCEADHDCTWLDPRLRCKPFLLEARRRCQPSEGTTKTSSWLKFPYAADGEIVKRAFVLRSVGTLPVTINQLQLTDGKASFFRLGKVSLPITLQPYEERVFAISLVGPVVAQEVGEIGVQSDAANASQARLALLVDAPACQLRVVAPFLANGNLDGGATSPGTTKDTPVSVANRGGLACQLSSISLSSVGTTSANVLTLVEQPEGVGVLDPGDAWAAKLRFAPDTSASSFQAMLRIKSNAPGRESLEIPVQGTTNISCLETKPNKLDFGFVEAACQSVEESIDLVFTGGSDCRDIKIEKVSLEAGSSSAFTIIKSPIGLISDVVGASNTITVRYRPGGLVSDRGVLVVETSQGPKGRLHIPLFGAGGHRVEQTDTFYQLKRPQADFLFVLSNAPSMKDKQSSLFNHLSDLVSWITRLNIDYQMMVITTDVSGKEAPAGCARGQVKIIDNATPNPIEAFLANTRVGTAGSAKGQGLEAAYQALSPKMLNDPQCNKGFLRKDAALSMIFVSDSDDQSPLTISKYVNIFEQLKGLRSSELTRASVIAGPPPTGCQIVGQGGADSAPRYWEISKRLKGIQESICDPNWGSVISNSGSIDLGYRRQFFLSKQADSSTITIKVNGRLIPEDAQEGWEYYARDNAISFSRTATPPPGALIEVRYKVFCAQ